MKQQGSRKGSKTHLAKKTWVEALFALGAMPEQVSNRTASPHDVKDAVDTVEFATRRLEE